MQFRLLGFVAIFFSSVAFGVQPDPAAKTDAEPAYIRVREPEGEDRLLVQIAIRSFNPKAAGPVVHLVGAIHIGDDAYYNALEEFLDKQDLVLFEGVKPALEGDAAHSADDAARIKVTKSRQRFLAVLVSRHRKEHGSLPASLDQLLEGVQGTVGRLGTAALKDGWGHPQVYSLFEDDKKRQRFDVISPGSDGAPGGDAAAADIKFTDQKPLTKGEVESAGGGIQVKLANALGLEFQLAAIDYNKPGWRNSDLSVDEVEEKLKAEGVSAAALFGLLDGRSLSARLISFMLSFIEGNPNLKLMTKVMLAEAIANSDELLEAQSGAGKSPAAFMKVIVLDRNDAVLKDLKEVIEQEPGVKSVALFYGAGHLPDLAKRLTGEFGYTPGEDRWPTGMDIDLNSVPHGAQQARQMRDMMRKMIERQRGKAAGE